MQRLFFRLITVTLFLYSCPGMAEVNLQVKIGQIIGNQRVETIKNVSANYNQDIEIKQAGLKNNIVINLKKFKDILVNGNKINPVQVDMKLVNEMKKMIGKPQTVTSFYNQSAHFTVSSKGLASENPDINISVKFEDI